MSSLLKTDPGDFAIEFAVTILVAISLITAATLLAARGLRRNPAARHCILLWGLVWILVSPLATIGFARAGFCLISLPGTCKIVWSSFEAMPTSFADSPVEVAFLPDGASSAPSDHRRALSSQSPPVDRSPDRKEPIELAFKANPSTQHAKARVFESATVSNNAGKRSARVQTLRTAAMALFAFWSLGTVLLLAGICRSYVRLHSIRRSFVPAPVESIGAVLDDVRRILNLPTLPEMNLSDRVHTPCVMGVYRSVVVLPSRWTDAMTSAQLRDVLLHECAHVLRRDCLVVLVQRITGALFWPHPLIHLLNRRLASVREEVCDNYVLAGGDAVSYGETLLRLAEFAGLLRPVSASVGILHWRGTLEDRIAGLIDESRSTRTRIGRKSAIIVAAVFGLLCMLTCGSGLISAQSPPQPTAPASTSAVPSPPEKLSKPAAPSPTPAKLEASPASAKMHVRLMDPLTKFSVEQQLTINRIELVKGQPHTVFVPEAALTALGIRRGSTDLLPVAKKPTRMPPLVLPGTTAFDPTSIIRIRATFGSSPSSVKVIELGQAIEAYDDGRRITKRSREIRSGDRVLKGELLVAFFSPDVANKKNELIDGIYQRRLDEEIVKRMEARPDQAPEALVLTARRNVQADLIAINRAEDGLRTWGLPETEIQALRNQAERVKLDDAQKRLREHDRSDFDRLARVEVRSPADGIIVERNVSLHEIVVDNTYPLLQVVKLEPGASGPWLTVFANVPQDFVPTLEGLRRSSPERMRWTVKTVHGKPLVGSIDDIGWLIDPNQRTAVVRGHVENKQGELRAGQFVSAAVELPVPRDVVEVPSDCVVDDGQQNVIFVQKDLTKPNYTLRRIEVAYRFDKTVFIRSKPFAKGEEITPDETEKGLLPKEPLLPGERIVQSGVGELKAAISAREAEANHRPQ